MGKGLQFEWPSRSISPNCTAQLAKSSPCEPPPALIMIPGFDEARFAARKRQTLAATVRIPDLMVRWIRERTATCSRADHYAGKQGHDRAAQAPASTMAKDISVVVRLPMDLRRSSGFVEGVQNVLAAREPLEH